MAKAPKEKMKIALVWPHGFDTGYFLPLALGYLKSNIDNAKYDIKVIDCSFDDIKPDSAEFQKIIVDFNPDMVCISCISTIYKSAKKTLEVVKSLNPDIITVIGGSHATAFPHETIKEKCIDFLFRGEAELSFREFLKEMEKSKPNLAKIKGLVYIENGKIKENEIGRPVDLDQIKIPDYDAINLLGYLKKGYKYNAPKKMNAPIWTTRGCPYRCQFCTTSLLNGKIIRKHSIEYIIKWIKYLKEKYNIECINFIDDNFTFHTDYAKDVCRRIIEEEINIKMNTPTGTRMQRLDEELLILMKKSGWINILISPESGSINTLKSMKKDLDPEIVLPKVRMIKKIGLKVHAAFMIGYPGETKDDIEKTLKLLRDCNTDFFFLNNFQPLPGTPIFMELVEKGEIESDFLPINYSDGARAYTPVDLKGVNFPRLVLMEYIRFYIKSPQKIIYALKMFPPGILAKKVVANIRNIMPRKETV